MRYFKPKNGRLPSYSTVRRVLLGISFDDLSDKFYRWAKDYIKVDVGDWLSIDGKAIRGTVSNGTTSEQNFISLIPIFCESSGSISTILETSKGRDETRTVSVSDNCTAPLLLGQS